MLSKDGNRRGEGMLSKDGNRRGEGNAWQRWKKRGEGMLGKDGNRRGEGNAWQRWKQEGRGECLAKMETGGGKERVEGRDCNERDTGGTVGKGIRWGWDEEAGGRLRD